MIKKILFFILSQCIILSLFSEEYYGIILKNNLKVYEKPEPKAAIIINLEKNAYIKLIKNNEEIKKSWYNIIFYINRGNSLPHNGWIKSDDIPTKVKIFDNYFEARIFIFKENKKYKDIESLFNYLSNNIWTIDEKFPIEQERKNGFFVFNNYAFIKKELLIFEDPLSPFGITYPVTDMEVKKNNTYILKYETTFNGIENNILIQKEGENLIFITRNGEKYPYVRSKKVLKE